jgi:hypothetical protein
MAPVWPPPAPRTRDPRRVLYDPHTHRSGTIAHGELRGWNVPFLSLRHNGFRPVYQGILECERCLHKEGVGEKACLWSASLPFDPNPRRSDSTPRLSRKREFRYAPHPLVRFKCREADGKLASAGPAEYPVDARRALAERKRGVLFPAQPRAESARTLPASSWFESSNSPTRTAFGTQSDAP